MAKIGPKEIQARSLREAHQTGLCEAIPSSDAARPISRKPKSVQPPSLKTSAAASGTTTYQYRDPEKRKAYMAKYMRGRRKRQAEQRAKEKQ